ncbi:MAG TPA: LysE family translocator [Spirochaetia bacterium]|nr:LysE family translocator [Spirochaetia bacterium]
MFVSTLIPYLGIVALITVTPGPDTALVVRNSIRRGRPAGLRTAAGCASGLIVWGVASALGISALIVTSPILFNILRLAGAAYLVFLGGRLLWVTFVGPANGPSPGTKPRALLTPFREGLVNNLLNPKTAAFYTAIIPQFLPANVPVLPATLVLASIACIASLLGLCAYAYLSSRAEGVLHSRRFAGWTDGLAGVVLLGLGAYVALRNTRL